MRGAPLIAMVSALGLGVEEPGWQDESILEIIGVIRFIWGL